MTIHTPICDLLGVEHPVLLAGMGGVSYAELVAAVSNAGGYGVLGLVVAWLIGTQASWLGYFLGVVIIGIADMTFLLAMVTSGVIAFSVESISGPVIAGSLRGRLAASYHTQDGFSENLLVGGDGGNSAIFSSASARTALRSLLESSRS